MNRSALESILIDGALASHRLDVTASAMRAEVKDITAHYSVANGDATLRDFHATLLEGELTAQGTMKNIGGKSHSDLVAAVRGISLEDMTRAASGFGCTQDSAAGQVECRCASLMGRDAG